MAHEINNPLAIIKSKAEQIAQKIERNESVSPEWILERVKVVDQTVDRIAKIIRGLKNFARDSRGEPVASVSMSTVIDETLSLCSARFISHDVAFSVDLPKSPVFINCRPVQLTQVFLNLLNNAFDAAMEAEKKWVKLEVRKTKAAISIAFLDSGKGVPESIRGKIMEPFFTTKEIGKGTGLGLSISRGIVEAHGGTIVLDESSPATKFVVSLPLAFDAKDISHVSY